MLATFALLVAGAGAFALARTADAPTDQVQPYGPDAPFGVDYVDGFGEHSPKPTRPATRKPRLSSASASAAPFVAAASAEASSLDTPLLADSSVSAVHWSRISKGRYETFVWVHNDGSDAAAWEVKVQLPDGAGLTDSSAVNRTFADGTWVFTSTKGSLGAGLVYLFSFSGTSGSTKYSLRSCAVNGSPCEPFR